MRYDYVYYHLIYCTCYMQLSRLHEFVLHQSRHREVFNFQNLGLSITDEGHFGIDFH